MTPAHAKLKAVRWRPHRVQLSWFVLRTTIALSLLLVLFLSQRFWYRWLWRWSSRWGTKLLRIGIRALYVIGLLLIIVSLVDALRNGHGSIIPRGTFLNVLAGLWFFSALFADLAVKSVHGPDLGVRFFNARTEPATAPCP